MKHLANCPADEFLAAAIKMKRPFADWIKKTGIPAIRERKPEGLEDMEPSERVKALAEAMQINMGDIFAAAIETDLEGTKELLCMATFTDPADFGTHTMPEYMVAISEMLNDTEVFGFFMYYLAPILKTSTKG